MLLVTASDKENFYGHFAIGEKLIKALPVKIRHQSNNAKGTPRRKSVHKSLNSKGRKNIAVPFFQRKTAPAIECTHNIKKES